MPKLDLDSLVYLGFQKREDPRVPMIHFYRHEEVWGMFGSRNVIRLNMDAKRILGRITQISFESFQNPIPLPKIR